MLTAATAPSYLFKAGEKPSLPLHEVPLVEAAPDSVAGYGRLVDDPDDCEIEIVRWPAQGWRPVDDGTGDEGGTVEGTFCGAAMRRWRAIMCWAGAAIRNRPRRSTPPSSDGRSCCGT